MISGTAGSGNDFGDKPFALSEAGTKSTEIFHRGTYGMEGVLLVNETTVICDRHA